MTDINTGLRQRNVSAKGQEEEVQGKESCPDEGVGKYLPKGAARIQRLIHASKDKAPSALQPYIEKLEPVLALLAWVMSKIIPMYLMILDKVEQLYKIVPEDLCTAIIGLLVCFCGGYFPTLIAAVEAWKVAGGETAQECLSICYEQFKVVRASNAADDQKDDDGDGIVDVDQISGDELLKRKTMLFLTTVNPKLLQDAIAGVYTGWIGVLATLKLEFAKTIALGASIGNMLQRPAELVLTPILARIMPKDTHPWIEVIINTLCKSIAISFAWTIQRIISAFHSAIRGGLMFSRGIMRYALKKGWISFDEDDSMLDEYSGWVTAALGFYTQLKFRFALPWILSLLLWPFTMAEWYIVWTISSE